MQFPLSIESDIERPLIGTWVLILAHVAVYGAMRGLGGKDPLAFALSTSAMTPLDALAAQFVMRSWGCVVGTAIMLGLFGGYIEQRLGSVRLIVLYLGLGALALLVAAWTASGPGPLAGPAGLHCLGGLLFLTAPAARIDMLTWTPAEGLRRPRVLRWPVWLWVGAFLLMAWVYAPLTPFFGASLLLPAVAVSIGLLAALVLRSRPLRRTGWYLPPEPRGGEVATRHDLDDAAATWRMLEEHRASRGRSTRDG